MKFYLLLIGVLSMTLSLTAQNSEDTTKEPQNEIRVPEILTRLSQLEAIEVDDHIITFKEVISDGRCPTKVTCVWPGEADVLIEIKTGDEIVSQKITIPALGTHKEVLSTPYHVVSLKNLAPYPVETNEDIASYQLLLKIEEKKS